MVYMGRAEAAVRDAHEGVRLADMQFLHFGRAYDRVQRARVFTNTAAASCLFPPFLAAGQDMRRHRA